MLLARRPLGVLLALVVCLLAAPMAGIVARAAPASAARLSLGVGRSSVTITDLSRSTPPRGPHGWLPSRTLPTTVFAPDQPGPWPLLVFAHGFNTNPDAYTPLLTAWAAAGYVVAAPEFPISGSDYPGAPRQDDIPEQARDLSAVISFFVDPGQAGPAGYGGWVDPARIGAGGHSDGGTTVAALAYNSATIDRRVRATAALAADVPYVPGGVNAAYNPGAFLSMVGTLDEYVPVSGARAVYDLAAGPKAFVVLQGAHHFSPYVDDPAFTDLTWSATIGFFDGQVRGDLSGRSRLTAAASTPGKSTIETVGLAPNPIGLLESVSATPAGVVHVGGWAIDPDTAAPVTVHVYADGALRQVLAAGDARPDLAAAFPDYGAAHGFSSTLADLATGDHLVCAFALNAGAGDTNILLGCAPVSVNHDPIGSLDGVGVDATAHVHARGWMLDPDTAAAGTVHLYVDNVFQGASPASTPRQDIAAAFPGYGAAHGFEVDLPPLAQGQHVVCAYGMNLLAGSANRLLGCTWVVVDHEPFGVIDTVTNGVGGAPHLVGWAVDPDTAAPVTVHAWVDGVFVGAFTADGPRPDVGAVLPGVGDQHGFVIDLPALSQGFHAICLYGLNQGLGAANRLLGWGCGQAYVDHQPTGSLDAVTVGPGRAVTVAGWNLDLDTVDPLGVHVYVDGVFVASGTASLPRGDIAQIFPGYGPLHGFSFSTPAVAAGVHQVCVYNINAGAGTNDLLACRTLVVP